MVNEARILMGNFYLAIYVKRVLSIGPVARSCNAKDRSIYCYPNYRYVSWLCLSFLHPRTAQGRVYPIDDTNPSTTATILQGYIISQTSTDTFQRLPYWPPYYFIVAKGQNIWEVTKRRIVALVCHSSLWLKATTFIYLLVTEDQLKITW